MPSRSVRLTCSVAAWIAEAAFIAAVKAASMGLRPHEVPQWAALLLGPTLRGAQVTLR